MMSNRYNKQNIISKTCKDMQTQCSELMKYNKHPTARIVSQLGGKADDRAEAPAGGLCRTASWVHGKP